VRPKPQTQQPKKPSAVEDEFAKEARAASGWVPSGYSGSVPEPDADRVAELEKLPDQVRALAATASTPESIRRLAATFTAIALVPPDEPVVLDFSSDLSQALLSETPIGAVDAKRLSQLLYAVMNSASLSGYELTGLKKEVAEILQRAGGLKDRVQTVTFDIQAINESIKQGGST
jgi:hypothetical protein